MNKEIWKDIEGYEGTYQISNFGRVKSNAKNWKTYKILKTNIPRGYFTVKLQLNKNKKNITIHRLIAKAFIPNPENKPQINHKDGNKLNNNMENLEWCNNSENQKHAFRIGLQTMNCDNFRNKKINKFDVIKIRNILKRKEYHRQDLIKIAVKYNITYESILNIKYFKTWVNI